MMMVLVVRDDRMWDVLIIFPCRLIHLFFLFFFSPSVRTRRIPPDVGEQRGVVRWLVILMGGNS